MSARRSLRTMPARFQTRDIALLLGETSARMNAHREISCAVWMYGEASDVDTTEDGKESGVAAAEQSSCGRAADGGKLPEEKHTVCFSDRGRSLVPDGLPGGAVCFASNVGLWHAFRALVQQYEHCR